MMHQLCWRGGKKIHQPYTMEILLDVLGMPPNRFIFCDNWYVPIERHVTDAEDREMLTKCGISKIQRLDKGRSTDTNYLAIHGGEEGKTMFGDGDLWYILEK